MAVLVFHENNTSSMRAYLKVRDGAGPEEFASSFPFTVDKKVLLYRHPDFRVQARGLSISGTLILDEHYNKHGGKVKLNFSKGVLIGALTYQEPALSKAIPGLKVGMSSKDVARLIPSTMKISFDDEKPDFDLVPVKLPEEWLSLKYFTGDVIYSKWEHALFKNYDYSYYFSFRSGRLISKNYDRIAVVE